MYWENVTSEPMVPLVLFRHRNFSGGSLSLALVEIANGGLLLVFTQYLQFVLGYSPVKAGLAFVPLAIGALVGNAGGVKAGATIGPRFLVLGGMLVMAASFGLLAMVSADHRLRRSRPSPWACSASARAWPCRPRSAR